MRKIIFFASVLFLLIPVIPVTALAITDNYPANAPIAGGVYIQANVTTLGNVLIFVPVEYQLNYLSFLRGTTNVINIGNATVTCNLYSGNNYQNYYQARFTRFGTLEYYYNYQGSNYRWDPLTVNSIQNTNVQFVDNTTITAIRQVPISFVIQLLTVTLLGMIVIILIIKRN